MPNTSAPSWVFQTPGWDVVRATPLIDDQLNIYARSSVPFRSLAEVSTIPGRVYKLSSEGELLWSYYCGEKGNLPGVGVLYDVPRKVFDLKIFPRTGCSSRLGREC